MDEVSDFKGSSYKEINPVPEAGPKPDLVAAALNPVKFSLKWPDFCRNTCFRCNYTYLMLSLI